MPIERVESLDDPRLADYRHVPDPELLRRGEVFVAEGRLVVRALLASSPFRTRSVLLTENAFRALADVIEPRLARSLRLPRRTGRHRGAHRLQHPPRLPGDRRAPGRVLQLDDLLTRLPAARRLVVLERIANADNMGGIFRNAAAFGADAVVLGPGCCDPLYRKAIRVSMGAALRVPFCDAGDWERGPRAPACRRFHRRGPGDRRGCERHRPLRFRVPAWRQARADGRLRGRGPDARGARPRRRRAHESRWLQASTR